MYGLTCQPRPQSPYRISGRPGTDNRPSGRAWAKASTRGPAGPAQINIRANRAEHNHAGPRPIILEESGYGG